MRTLELPNTKERSHVFKEWLAEKHGHGVEFFPEESYGYGIVGSDGEIEMACVLQNFHFPGDILASYFADSPKIFFSKMACKALRDVPFHEPFNAKRITIILNTKHHRSVEVAIRYGFQGEGILRDHFGGEDGTLLSLLRRNVVEE